MSYILDALRRADSERERGAVPGIHAQPVPPGGIDGDPERRAAPTTWVIGALSIALAAALAWNFARREAEPSIVLAPPAPLPAALPAAPVAPARVAEPASPPAATVAVQPSPPSPPAREPAAARKTPPAAAPPTPRAAPKADADAAPASRIVTFEQLPEPIRRELPAVQIGGSIYSPSPASRFLIINGQTFREGDRISGELVLEQIQPKAAVLRFREHRYRVPY